MGELLTLREVGIILKLKPETVRRFWIQTGKLPALRIGYQWRVDADNIPAAIELRNRELEARAEAARKRKLESNAFKDLNATIAPGGECTRPSEQDQLQRETRGREWTPPDTPE
jgi:hypothetical protein